MSAPYRANQSEPEPVRWYGPFPVSGFLVPLLCLFTWLTWFNWYPDPIRDRIECAGGKHGQCVVSRNDPQKHSVTIQRFFVSQITSSSLVPKAVITTPGRAPDDFNITLNDGTQIILTDMSLNESLRLEDEFSDITIGWRKSISYDSGDPRWHRWYSLLSALMLLVVARWAWVQRAPVRMRWIAESRTLELIEQVFFKRQVAHYKPTERVHFDLHENSKSFEGIPIFAFTTICLMGIQTHSNSKTTRTKLTRGRVGGIGIHLQAVFDLFQLLGHVVPHENPQGPEMSVSDDSFTWLRPRWELTLLFVGLALFITLARPLDQYDHANQWVTASIVCIGVAMQIAVLIAQTLWSRKDTALFHELKEKLKPASQ